MRRFQTVTSVDVNGLSNANDCPYEQRSHFASNLCPLGRFKTRHFHLCLVYCESFAAKVSGKDMQRPQLDALLDFVQKGYPVAVLRTERLPGLG
jgi:hypothetical protein